MNLAQPLKNPQTLRWLLLAAFIVLLLSMPALAENAANNAGNAANPLSGITFAGNNNKDLSGMFGFFIKLVITALPFVAVIAVFSEAIFGVFGSLRQALRDGNLGGFFLYLLLVLIGVGLALWLGYYMFELVGKFESFWPKSK